MVKKIKQQGFVLVLSLVMLASMSLIGTLLVFSSNEENRTETIFIESKFDTLI